MAEVQLGTRAVVRIIEPGLACFCPDCDTAVKFRAQVSSGLRRKVVANVYYQGKWNRVEHWHLLCYIRMGEIHGRLDDLKPELREAVDELFEICEDKWAPEVQLMDQLDRIHRLRRAQADLS